MESVETWKSHDLIVYFVVSDANNALLFSLIPGNRRPVRLSIHRNWKL
jgi:hypothetical protein